MSQRRRDSRRVPDDTRLLELADRANIDDPGVQQLLARGLPTDDPYLRRRIAKVLATKAAEEQTIPFIDYSPNPSVEPAGIQLGTTLTGSRYSLQEEDLTRHLLAVGKSGAGKTTLFYNIMRQLSIPFWSFDLKQDYRHLVQDNDLDLLVLPWTKFKFNPLAPPPGVRPRRWVQVFGEIFGHATSLLSGSKNYLMKQLVKLYQVYGLLDDVQPPYPSLLELQLLIERDKINYVRKQTKYRDTVQNRLAAMHRTAGRIFNCSEGYPLDDLLDRNVVFEFDGIGEDTQNFLMEILIAYVYEYRMSGNQRGGELRHVFFMDEGKRVFSVYKERQEAAGLPTIDELTAKMREFGEGLVVADQEASKLTDSIKANTDTKILLSTGDAKQFQEMAESMFLSQRQQELAQQVAVGEAIVQAGDKEPIPVNLERYELEKTVSDDDLAERQAEKWDKLSAEPRQNIPAFEEAIEDKIIEPEDEGLEEVDSSDETEGIELSDSAERLLEDVVEHPFKPLSERYELFPSMEKGNAAKTELVEKEVVVERQIRVKSVKRKLLEITSSGRKYLEKKEDVELDQEGRGGIIHRFWQHKIREVFEEAGWTAEAELFDADVYVNMVDVELVIEVAMGDNAREIQHIEDRLETFDMVWVACRNEKIREGLEQRLEESDASTDCVTFRLFRDFVDDEIASIG
jgi:hypothetical protein